MWSGEGEVAAMLETPTSCTASCFVTFHKLGVSDLRNEAKFPRGISFSRGL